MTIKTEHLTVAIPSFTHVGDLEASTALLLVPTTLYLFALLAGDCLRLVCPHFGISPIVFISTLITYIIGDCVCQVQAFAEKN